MRLDLHMEIKYQEGAGETTRKEEMKASGRGENETWGTNGQEKHVQRTDGSEVKQMPLDENSVSFGCSYSHSKCPTVPTLGEGDKPANGTERSRNRLASTYGGFIPPQTPIHITPGFVLAL